MRREALDNIAAVMATTNLGPAPELNEILKYVAQEGAYKAVSDVHPFLYWKAWARTQAYFFFKQACQ